ncbi:MAG TPA: ROK family transcriptional regulator, partial [Paraburkholderia sp.]|uniref:ROK family transcriptional regulator n=1 Tax=Paraburkholderia sp. TaxID=1926495 RepID=UPI002B480B9B
MYIDAITSIIDQNNMLPWLHLGLHPASSTQVHHAQHLSSYLARLIASGQATSRSELARVTGLARSTVSQHLMPLLRMRLISEQEATGFARGRPPSVLSLNPQAGVILIADIGAAHGRLGIADFGQHFLLERSIVTEVARGPEPVLADLQREFASLLAQLAIPRESVRLIVIGLPAPIDFATGAPIRPPIMPGWDHYPVPASFKEFFAGEVLVDNDVNLMALGEARCRSPSQCPLLYVKVSTGIGCGIITHDGLLHRGADGAAGDIGHVRMPAHEELCRCGNLGCIEAFASFGSLVRKLGLDGGADSVQGLDAAKRAELATLVHSASSDLGELIAMLVHFFNPRVVALGGSMTQFGAEMLASVRAVVYRRALPLATRALSVELSVLNKRAGLVGGVVLGVEHILS